ncbi:ABC transporter ATP-binding protein [Gordonia sinesedis]
MQPRTRVATGGALFRLVKQAIVAHPLLIFGILAAQLVSAFATLAQPALNASIIDRGIVVADAGHIRSVAVVMVIIALVGLAGGLAVAILGADFATRVASRTRIRVYRHAMALSRNDFHRFGPATLMTRTGADTTTIAAAMYSLVSIAASAPLLAVGAVIGSLRIATQLTPLILVAAVLLGVVVGFLVARMVPLADRTQRAVDDVAATLREQLTGIRVVRIFGRERQESQRFGAINDELTSLARRMGTLQVLILPAVLLIANLTSVAATAWGASLIDSGSMQIGQLTAFTGYLSQVAVGVSLMVAVTAILPRAAVSAQRIDEVLGTDPDPSVVDPRSAAAPRRHTTATPVATDSPVALEFAGVSYRYPGADRPALDGIDLRCPAGELTGIIGGTAAGKSTLLAMIPRLAEPQDGSVLVGGIDTTDWEPEDLRSLVGYVGPGQSLLAGDIAGNLRLGHPDATDTELWEALAIARADDFVRARGGLATAVTQGGTNFSGGQRQRLAIARALLGHPRILCLDDSFSAMNHQVAAEILDGIRHRLPDCTVVLAVQQPALLRDADGVAVLIDGRLDARGRHIDLRRFSAGAEAASVDATDGAGGES